MIPISSFPKRFVSALNKRNSSISVLKPVQVTKTLDSSRLIYPRFLSALTSKDSTRDLQRNNISSALQYDYEYSETRLPEKHRFVKRSPLTGPRNDFWYTGLLPSKCPGYDATIKQVRSLPQLNLHQCTKQKLKDYFDNTWTLTEVLLSGLQGEKAFMQPPAHGLRHPMIFYYGHPAALYVNKLRVAGLLKASVNQYFEVIFETGNNCIFMCSICFFF